MNKKNEINVREKESLRQKMRRKLGLQTKLERRNKSLVIEKKVFSQAEFLSAKCLMLYVSKGTKEVET